MFSAGTPGVAPEYTWGPEVWRECVICESTAAVEIKIVTSLMHALLAVINCLSLREGSVLGVKWCRRKAGRRKRRTATSPKGSRFKAEGMAQRDMSNFQKQSSVLDSKRLC